MCPVADNLYAIKQIHQVYLKILAFQEILILIPLQPTRFNIRFFFCLSSFWLYLICWMRLCHFLPFTFSTNVFRLYFMHFYFFLSKIKSQRSSRLWFCVLAWSLNTNTVTVTVYKTIYWCNAKPTKTTRNKILTESFQRFLGRDFCIVYSDHLFDVHSYIGMHFFHQIFYNILFLFHSASFLCSFWSSFLRWCSSAFTTHLKYMCMCNKGQCREEGEENEKRERSTLMHLVCP